MPIQRIGLNLNLTNISQINISSIPTKPDQILTETLVLANTTTNYWLAFIVLIPMMIISFLAFSDRTQFSDFKYGDVRALNLAFGVVALFGITGAEIGLYLNLESILFFVVIFMLLFWAVWAFENKE